MNEARSRMRVRYAETDQMGVVYYANYLIWFEVGRTDWLRETGWSYRDMEADGYSLPVIETRCSYVESARYDDVVEVRTTSTLESPVRIQFLYDVVRAADSTRLATGMTMHAALGRDGRPRRLPDRVRTLYS